MTRAGLTTTAATVLLAGVLATSAAPREGYLVLVGGGPTPAAVFTRTLAVAGGRAARIVVLPQTYPNDSLGDAAVSMWKGLGVSDVATVSLDDPVVARRAVERATLIWMPGGFQGLLMRRLAGTPVPDLIRERFAAGVTIGGASAGAAAMSQTMIDDESTPDGQALDGPATAEGLGLWPEAIVSPHFTERRRMNALVALLGRHPNLIGVGIDEGTAAFVSNGEIEVQGRGTVVIVGGPRARTLRAGMRYRYRRGTKGR